jgi:hypothetical protein
MLAYAMFALPSKQTSQKGENMSAEGQKAVTAIGTG